MMMIIVTQTFKGAIFCRGKKAKIRQLINYVKKVNVSLDKRQIMYIDDNADCWFFFSDVEGIESMHQKTKNVGNNTSESKGSEIAEI